MANGDTINHNAGAQPKSGVQARSGVSASTSEPMPSQVNNTRSSNDAFIVKPSFFDSMPFGYLTSCDE